MKKNCLRAVALCLALAVLAPAALAADGVSELRGLEELEAAYGRLTPDVMLEVFNEEYPMVTLAHPEGGQLLTDPTWGDGVVLSSAPAELTVETMDLWSGPRDTVVYVVPAGTVISQYEPYDDIIGLSGSTDPDGTYHSNTYLHEEEYVDFREQMPITVEAGWLYCFDWPDSKNTPVYVRGASAETETPEALPFTDVAEDAWYREAVAYVHENGLMGGVDGDTFDPSGATTRGMVVTILYRLAGAPAAEASGFTDVAAGSWYADAVAWAAENGVVTGYDDGTFAPGRAVTRQELAVILHRYAALRGLDTTQGGMAIREYADFGEVAGYAQEAMGWAVSAGLISGTGGNRLSPRLGADRATTATILMRFCTGVAAE